MSERSDIFWGLIIGLVGNLLVSTAFALVEHPEWGLYLNPMYIFSWITFVAYGLFLLFREEKEKKKEEPRELKAKKEEGKKKEKPRTESLIAEYRVLNEAIRRRGSDSLLVNSIMIPSSIAILIFAVQFRRQLGEATLLFNLPVAGFIPLLALLLVIIPYALHWTTKILDEKYFKRIHEIEDELKIKGLRCIHNEIRYETWYNIRRYIRHLFFLALIVIYVCVSIWLFRKGATFF